MIQINLLPSVKVKFVKSQKLKRTVILVCAPLIIVSIASVSILAFIVYGGQRSQLSSLDQQSKSVIAQLEGVQGLGKILTIQNQLNNLDSLHAKKPVTSRLFPWLEQLTPNHLSISTLSFDYSTKTITITGEAPNSTLVNQFADTLKFTNYVSDATKNNSASAFSDVVLSSFSFTSDKNLNIVNYTLNAKIDTSLFVINSKNIKLQIPNQVTTRSQTENPDLLFKTPIKPSTAPTSTNNVTTGGN